MNDLISMMKTHLFQGQIETGLEYAYNALDTLDPDDDDDAETLRELLETGLRANTGGAFAYLLRIRNFDFSITWPGKAGLAVLFAEANSTDANAFKIMEEGGMDPFLAQKDGNTVLHLLAKNAYSRSAQERETLMVQLVTEREDISGWMESNAYGVTPMHLAALGHHGPLLDALLARGVSPDITGTAVRSGFGYALNPDGVTALQLACSIGDTDSVERLLKGGADDSLRDTEGRTACHYAVEIPNKHFCEEYYENIPGEDRVLGRKAEIIRLLTCVDTVDDKGETPLLAALKTYRFDAGGFAQVLLEKGADPNKADNTGRTPLMAAAERHHKEAVKALVEAGADVNARGRDGETAVLLAVREGDEKIARYLLKKGADATIPDNTGETAGDVAAQKGMEGVLELLI